MITLFDRDELRQYLTRIVEELRENALEVMVFLALLGGFLLLLLWYAARSGLRRGQEQRRAEQRVFRGRTEAAQLSAAEQRVLGMLLRAARRRRVAAHRVVADRMAFDGLREALLDSKRAARRRPGDPPLETTLASLRVKLGLARRAAEAGRIHSTADLPAGARGVLLVGGDAPTGGTAGRRVVVELAGSTPSALRLRLPAGAVSGEPAGAATVGTSGAPQGGRPDATATVPAAAPRLAPGTPVRLVVPLSSGLYRTASVVLKSGSADLSLAHRERVQRIERRQWARGRRSAPAWLIVGAGRGVAYRCGTIEVGGGGATVVMADHKVGHALARLVAGAVGGDADASAADGAAADARRAVVLRLEPAGRRPVSVAGALARVSARPHATAAASRADAAAAAGTGDPRDAAAAAAAPGAGSSTAVAVAPALHLRFAALRDAERDRLIGLAHEGWRRSLSQRAPGRSGAAARRGATGASG